MNIALRTRLFFWFVILFSLLIIFHESRFKGDLEIFLSASRDMWSGKNIYLEKYNLYYHYYYSILFAFLITPLTFLPLYFHNLIWLLLNLFFSYRIWRILRWYLPLNKLSDRQKLLFSFLSLLFIFAFWRKNIQLSQMTICLMYLSFEGINLIHRKMEISGAALIALGINIKLLPIVLLPYLLYRTHYRAFVFALAFLAVYEVVPVFFMEPDYYQSLQISHWELINPGNRIHLLDVDERSFHSITTLVSTLLVENARNNQTMDLPRNIADVSMGTLFWVINAIRCLLIVTSLYFLRFPPFRREKNRIRILRELGYILLTAVLIFPHQQHYAFFFAFPATTYLVFFIIAGYGSPGFVAGRIKWLFLTAILLIYFAYNSHMWFEFLQNLMDHYKTLTYGSLLLLIMLAICKPEQLPGAFRGEMEIDGPR